MTHEEAQELLGAYALNAVDGEERTQLEHHVQECVRCASELDALREVAGAMGNVGEPASQELWQRISTRLYDDVDDTRVPPIRALDSPHATISPFAARPRSWGRTRYGALVLAAAAAVLVGVLSVSLVRANNHVAQLTNALSVASHNVVDAALETPGHVNVTLNDAHSVGVAKFVLVDGHGYLVSSQMSTLSADQTYQLWGIFNGRAISIGLMGSSPSTVYFSVEGSKRPTELAVTIEPAGGSVAPTTPVVASGRVSA